MPIAPIAPKTEPAVPTNNLAVFGFCELWGLIFGLPPGEDLYRGAPVTAHMVAFLAIGGAFAILGPTWPSLKSKFPRRLSATFVRAASDFRWWLIALLFGLVVPGLVGRFARQPPTQVVSHPRDFDSGEIVSTRSPQITDKQHRDILNDYLGGFSIYRGILDANQACKVKIVTTIENQDIRAAIRSAFTLPGSKFQIIDDDIDGDLETQRQYQNPDSTATPQIPKGVWVRAPKDVVCGDVVAQIIGSLSLAPKRNYTLPLGMPSPDVVLIEIGPGSPWSNP